MDQIELFHDKLRAVPEKEGKQIFVQTHDIHGWSILTREEALHTYNYPGGINGETNVYYDTGLELIFTMTFPYSFDRILADRGEEE